MTYSFFGVRAQDVSLFFVAPLLDLASKHARTVWHSITVLVLSAFSYFCLLSPLLFFAVQYMRRKNIKLLCRMSDTAPHLRTTGINSPPCHSDNVAKPIGTLTESSMAVKRVALLFFAFAAALASVQGQCELICCLYSCVFRKGKKPIRPTLFGWRRLVLLALWLKHQHGTRH